MSTSPDQSAKALASVEAKQAAKYSIREVNGAKHLFRYDEDRGLPNNAELQFWYELQEASVATAKLREEMAEAEKQADKWYDRWSNLVAHQQPSAPTHDVHDCAEIDCPEHKHAPDVEKIARETEENIEFIVRNIDSDENVHEEVRRELKRALARARAPLVAALEKIIDIEWEGSPGAYTTAEGIARAALAGTGERDSSARSKNERKP